MLNTTQREHLNRLREAEMQRTLTATEQAELAALFQIIIDAEAAYLQPAIDAMKQKRKQMEAELAEAQSFLQHSEAALSRSRMELMLLTEAVLAKDWLRPEEDEAWRDL